MSTATSSTESSGLDFKRRVIARHTVFNILAEGVPILVATITIPLLIDLLGGERWSALTLILRAAGSLALLDLGLNRVLAKLIAERIGTSLDWRVAPLVWTGLGTMAAMGLAVMAVAWLAAPWLARSVFAVAAHLTAETTQSLRLLAVSVPLVILTAGLRGILEAHQRFGALFALRLPLNLMNYSVPLAAYFFDKGLVPVVVAMVSVRAFGLAAHLAACMWLAPALRRRPVVDAAAFSSFWGFGWGVALGNILGPVILFVDGFLLGRLINQPDRIAFYNTPLMVLTYLSIIPAGVAGAVFPALTAAIGQAPAQADRLYRLSLKGLFIVFFPIVMVMTVLAADGLELWLGREYARESTIVVQLLLLGVLFNSLAIVPHTLIHAVGRPHATALLHLIELPIYIAAFVYFTLRYGLAGAAGTWAARCVIDALALFMLAQRYRRVPWRDLQIGLGVLAATVAIAGATTLLTGLAARMAVAIGGVPVFVIVAWYFVLSTDERRRLRELRPY